ncbi:AMP-binding enzyme [Pseudonocardia sp. GCM10023141]|uniref:AMP-binding enzyme n=1 Tax=Pseudonocardia sp. GCM10023141 TaxID=3252653 RepID=UPI00360CBBF3
MVGVPHEEFGEQVTAIVEPTSLAAAGPDLATELVAHCRAKLAPAKCPRSIQFRETLPRLASCRNGRCGTSTSGSRRPLIGGRCGQGSPAQGSQPPGTRIAGVGLRHRRPRLCGAPYDVEVEVVLMPTTGHEECEG